MFCTSRNKITMLTLSFRRLLSLSAIHVSVAGLHSYTATEPIITFVLTILATLDVSGSLPIEVPFAEHLQPKSAKLEASSGFVASRLDGKRLRRYPSPHSTRAQPLHHNYRFHRPRRRHCLPCRHVSRLRTTQGMSCSICVESSSFGCC